MIDLRSDTVTKPTDNMRERMMAAAVGDDVYRDDPTVIELEKHAATLLNKQAALFVPSGTFGNQLSLFVNAPRGSEVLCGSASHVLLHEVGAAAVIAGVTLRTAHAPFGTFDLEELEGLVRADDIHFPTTSMVCVENAHSSGAVVSLPHMQSIYQWAKRHDLFVHIDGARIFNAATALNVGVDELAACGDSINICLSKGLCAPVGSLLLGSYEMIERARKARKLMGGGMRQVGILAAAGLEALEMRKRLAEDHRRAKLLAEGLQKIEGIQVAMDRVAINMVFFSLREGLISEEKFVQSMLEKGIVMNGMEAGEYRLVTHRWISDEEIGTVISAVESLVSS